MKPAVLKTEAARFRLALAALLFAGAAAWLLSHNAAGESAVPPAGGRPALTVRTVMLAEDQWPETLSANGSIVPWQEAVIGAQLQGVRVADVKVSIGDRVRRGEVLATLDNALRPVDEGASQGRIVAPDDGVISSVSANVGSMPQTGSELFRLIRQGRLEWQAELTAGELMRLRQGMRVTITLADGRTVRGSVRAISPKVEMQTRFGHALVRLDDSRGIIAGVFARGTFQIGAPRRAQWLPPSAVMQRGDLDYVLVVDADGRVHERTVQTGRRHGARIEIRKGLLPGEPVVESGGPFLTEGDRVQLVKE